MSSTSLGLFLLAILTIVLAAIDLLIGAVFTFGKVGGHDAKVSTLERITANQCHVIESLTAALEGTLDYISANLAADSIMAKNWALALEDYAADLPYLSD